MSLFPADEIIWTDCDCHSMDHAVRFTKLNDWPVDGKSSVEMDVYLNNHLGFFRRAVVALNYVFGRRLRGTDLAACLFKREDAPKLQRVVDWLKEEV